MDNKERRVEMIKIKDKNGQVAMFVILGLIIIGIIAAILLFMNRPGAKINAAEDPGLYIRSCVEKKLEVVEAEILKGNGYQTIEKNYMVYRGERVPYLCKSTEFYTPCVNQEPLFIEKVKKEIGLAISEHVDLCFESLLKDLKRKGYSTKTNDTIIEINLEEDKLIADIEKGIVITKGEEKKAYSNFATEIQSPLYNLLKTTQVILNYESALCGFNNVDWMLAFKNSGVKRFVTSDGTKVYEIKDKLMDEGIKIAIKSCVLPGGI